MAPFTTLISIKTVSVILSGKLVDCKPTWGVLSKSKQAKVAHQWENQEKDLSRKIIRITIMIMIKSIAIKALKESSIQYSYHYFYIRSFDNCNIKSFHYFNIRSFDYGNIRSCAHKVWPPEVQPCPNFIYSPLPKHVFHRSVMSPSPSYSSLS